MASAETRIVKQALLDHGSRPDTRLFRNETSGAWVGNLAGRTKLGHVVLANARMIQAGLCVGSSDVIGIGPGGLFTAAEFKTSRGRPTEQQVRFLEMVVELGGLGGIARSSDDLGRILAGEVLL